MMDYLQVFLLQPNQPSCLQLASHHLHLLVSATPARRARGGGVCYVPCPISTAATSRSPRTDVPTFGDSLWLQTVCCKALKSAFRGRAKRGGDVHLLCPAGMGAPILQSRALGTSPPAAGEVGCEQLTGDQITLFIFFVF